MLQLVGRSRTVGGAVRRRGKWSTVGNSVCGALCLQARINSSRLPCKALFKIGTASIIEYAMARLSCIAECVPYLLTDSGSAPFFAEVARRHRFYVLTGSSTNVLQRFVSVILSGSLPFVVRATADNPLVSVRLARASIDAFHRWHCDLFAFEDMPRGYGVEVVSSRALLTACTHGTNSDDFEHVTHYIYRNSDAFRVVHQPLPVELARSLVVPHDVTVDTENDYASVLNSFHYGRREGRLS